MNTSDRRSNHDPAWPQFVAASIEEIRLAEQLRRQIEQRYLAQSNAPSPSGTSTTD
jgi:hypothetical protein